MINWIVDNLLTKNGKLNAKKCNKEWLFKHGFSEKYSFIISTTLFLDDINPVFTQRVWHILKEFPQKYKCQNPKCNNTTKFMTFTNGYLRTCGNKCAQLDTQTINKIQSTNLQKYGKKYGLSNKNIIEKSKKTWLKKYGVDNPTKVKKIRDKVKKTNLKLYGIETPLQDRIKMETALLKKYGVKNIQHSEDIKRKTIQTRRSDFYDTLFDSNRLNGKVIPLFTKNEYLSGGYLKSYNFKCIKCNTKFLDCLEDGDIPRCTTCYKNSSLFEKQITEYIKSIIPTENVVENDKTILSGLELDIYIQNLKLAVECNGLFWHGEINGNKNKKYHLNKTIECEKQGIHLIHIFEDEWLLNEKIVKNRLLHILKKDNNKVYARNCEVKVITSKESNNFLKETHIQGCDKSSIKLGLYYQTELVSVMTFGCLRVALGNKVRNVNEYEMYRYATSKNVIGGASKLLSYFIKTYKPSKIISYADRRWSFKENNLYNKIGFKLISETPPNYWYFGNSKNYKRFHRFIYRKDQLNKKLKTFNPTLTEWKNMTNNGWDRIWDCGSLKYQLDL